MNEPIVKVGIVASQQVSFTLEGVFQSGENRYSGIFQAEYNQGRIVIGEESAIEWLFEPLSPESFFEIQDVVIGIEFHWERKEVQRFRGSLQLIPENNTIRVVNQLPVEEYLLSVISSEMSATASTNLLKAHAVISRSWLLYPILQPESQSTISAHTIDTAEKRIRWYERDAHTRFDVCADDHCQRYQGITRASTEKVRQAIEETRGLVLMDGDKLCDARYYKACGGITERFDSCWADEHFSYLVPVRDAESNVHETDIPNRDAESHVHETGAQGHQAKSQADFPDLTREDAARNWILSSPDAFCNTSDSHILSQVLNNYDQETMDFYRWTVVYTQEQLQAVLKRKSGIDFGNILDMQAIRRGPSGRIIELKITGDKHTLTVGKELEIRKWLSESHLYSSAFVVDREPAGAITEPKAGAKPELDDDANAEPAAGAKPAAAAKPAADVPERFILHGAGWGHGVGLCQIGAAVMGEKGYNYQQILNHYFSHAAIQKIY